MKRLLFLILIFVIWTACGSAQTHWVSAYYAGWAKWNPAPVDIPLVDFSCATHWIFFTMAPTASGTFDGTLSGMDTVRLRQFPAAAHGAGKKALIGTGGWGCDYTGAVTNTATSISFLTNLMKTYGYDGVDIDWEPVPSAQYASFSTWVKNLKAAMQAVNPNAVLTAAALGFDQGLVNNQQYLDQINMMTYDMSGPFPGWVSWHNSAIYDGGNRFPSTGGLMPSIDASANNYLNAGLPAAKLGFGIEFYGYIWNGVSGPMQGGFGTVQNTVPYAQIMDTYGSLPLKWDAGAQASYYSAANQFVSFDAETSMTVKSQYLKSKGLGGVILYEVAAGYRDNLPVGYKDHLLQTVKQAFMGGTPPPPDTVPPAVQITSPGANASLVNQSILKATASDNVGVIGVQFQIDGKPLGKELTASPYNSTFDTWLFANGKHTLSAVGRDWAGNKGTAAVSVTIANSGVPPKIPDEFVYDDSLRAVFINASWGATVDFSNPSPVSANSTRSAKVSYNAWGGFDILSGSWSNEKPIDITLYDSLKFDVFSPAQITLTVGFYVGNKTDISVPSNTWRTYSIPLPTDLFSRFYFQSGTGNPATVYFDNIILHALRIPTGATGGGAVPRNYTLEQNYPNPFNPSTTIRFSLPATGHVSLVVYDLLGNEVATLVNEIRPAGTYNEVFDAASGWGGRGSLASGMYFYRLVASNYNETRRFLLLK